MPPETARANPDAVRRCALYTVRFGPEMPHIFPELFAKPISINVPPSPGSHSRSLSHRSWLKSLCGPVDFAAGKIPPFRLRGFWPSSYYSSGCIITFFSSGAEIRKWPEGPIEVPQAPEHHGKSWLLQETVLTWYFSFLF